MFAVQISKFCPRCFQCILYHQIVKHRSALVVPVALSIILLQFSSTILYCSQHYVLPWPAAHSCDLIPYKYFFYLLIHTCFLFPPPPPPHNSAYCLGAHRRGVCFGGHFYWMCDIINLLISWSRPNCLAEGAASLFHQLDGSILPWQLFHLKSQEDSETEGLIRGIEHCSGYKDHLLS